MSEHMKKFVLLITALFSTSFASAAEDSASELAALKAQLKMLTPANYIGRAIKFVDELDG